MSPPDAARAPGSTPKPSTKTDAAAKQRPLNSTRRTPMAWHPLAVLAGPMVATEAGRCWLNQADVDAAMIARTCLEKGLADGIWRGSGYSKETVAAVVGVSIGALDHWHTGRRRPNLPNEVRFGRMLHGLIVEDRFGADDTSPAGVGPEGQERRARQTRERREAEAVRRQR